MSNPSGDDGVPPDSASNPSIAPFFGTPGQLHTHKQWTDLLLPFFFAFFSPFSFTDFSSSWSFGRTERTHRKTHHSGDFLRFNYERTHARMSSHWSHRSRKSFRQICVQGPWSQGRFESIWRSPTKTQLWQQQQRVEKHNTRTHTRNLEAYLSNLTFSSSASESLPQ